MSDAELLVFLSRSYAFKTRADYETDFDNAVTPAQAAEAIDHAARFVATIEALLNTPTPDGP
jgi:uncharacterized protein (UPF0332 family)